MQENLSYTEGNSSKVISREVWEVLIGLLPFLHLRLKSPLDIRGEWTRAPGGAGKPQAKIATLPCFRASRLTSYELAQLRSITRGQITAENSPRATSEIDFLCSRICLFAAELHNLWSITSRFDLEALPSGMLHEHAACFRPSFRDDGPTIGCPSRILRAGLIRLEATPSRPLGKVTQRVSALCSIANAKCECTAEPGGRG
jgi:hypothetical protein